MTKIGKYVLDYWLFVTKVAKRARYVFFHLKKNSEIVSSLILLNNKIAHFLSLVIQYWTRYRSFLDKIS